ncbi:MAG: hypothetical protein WCX73_02445 [Candidatus Pacearchaeota archaeon]|jgi:hypothetical protein
MFNSQKNVFWQALLITIIIFGLGISFGFVLENWRTSQIKVFSQQAEIDLLDIKLQNDIYSKDAFNCEMAVQENLAFADRTYEQAQTLGRYEKASRLTEDLKIQHEKYDLLRTMLWLNSIEIKEKCNSSYYEVVYFYQYNNDDLSVKAEQEVFSKLLLKLKEEKGQEVLLIPIAVDNNLSSINILLDKYDINDKRSPVILINREIKITKLENIEDLLKNFE